MYLFADLKKAKRSFTGIFKFLLQTGKFKVDPHIEFTKWKLNQRPLAEKKNLSVGKAGVEDTSGNMFARSAPESPAVCCKKRSAANRAGPWRA